MKQKDKYNKYNYNSKNVLTVEIKMTDKKNRIILTIINMLT